VTWVTRRIEHLAREVRATVDPTDLNDEEVDHYSIPALDANGEPERQPASEIKSSKQLLSGGEVLISRLNPRKARVLTVPPLTGRKALASGEFVVLRPTQVAPRFLEYLLFAERTRQDLDGAVQSVTRSHQRIRPEQLLKMAVTVPASIAVQRKIADFLRTETTRIDALIARKRHLSSLLNERTEAHVSGLMVDAASRFGERPLKAAAELRISNVDKRSYEGQVKVRLCNYTDVYYHREIDSSIEFMIATADPAQVRRLSLRAGDVLITKDSETADDIAVPSLVVETVPELVLGYHLALLRPIDVDGSFLYWAIRSRRCRDEFSLAASGVTRMGLRQDAMGRVRIPAAPLSAQRKIVNQAESVVRKSEQLCRHLGVQIALLREHRQALITAAVTGDLEIPEVAR
jgi:type I restriction enzyme, S subunit